jgi:hypothetical protein
MHVRLSSRRLLSRSRCFSGPDFMIEVEAIAFVDN